MQIGTSLQRLRRSFSKSAGTIVFGMCCTDVRTV